MAKGDKLMIGSEHGQRTFIEDFKLDLTFKRIEGQENVYSIQLRRDGGQPQEPELRPEERDKFAKDISDGFEQVF
jgi:hypothetical protein